MGRPGAAKRLKKAEKAKVQLKGYATKFLPKGKNVTDTTFKVRKIVLQNQIKAPDLNEALTRKKLSIKEVLARLQHYSSAQRLEGLSGMAELLHEMDKKQLTANMLSIVDNLGRLSLDVESRVRCAAARVLTALLTEVNEVELSPFSNILGSYISCAMTHIKPGVQEDSLLLLDALLQHVPSIIALSASQLLSCSLDMISRLRDEKGVNRQLSVNLSSSLTSSAWRASVLARLQALLQVSITQLLKKSSEVEKSQTLFLTTDALKETYFPLYNCHYSSSSCLDKVFHLKTLSKSCHQPLEDSMQLRNYTESLVPLLLDSWLEVNPLLKSTKHEKSENGLSFEAGLILHFVLEILFLLWQHLILWDKRNGCSELTDWFKNRYTNDLKQHLALGFPYAAQANVESDSEEETSNKRQKHRISQSANCDATAMFNIALPNFSHFKRNTSACDGIMKCVPQNLRLCIVFNTLMKSPPISLKNKMVTFLTTCLNDWDASCAPWNDHLILALEKALECSVSWACNMNPLVSAIVKRYKVSSLKMSQTHRLFAQSICELLGKIAMSTNFPHMKLNESLCSWLYDLPSSLNTSCLSVKTIHLLIQLACQRNEKLLQGLQDAVPSLLHILQNLPPKSFEVPTEESIGLVSLLYWIPSWNEQHVQVVQEVILRNNKKPLTSKLVHLLSIRQNPSVQPRDS